MKYEGLTMSMYIKIEVATEQMAASIQLLYGVWWIPATAFLGSLDISMDMGSKSFLVSRSPCIVPRISIETAAKLCHLSPSGNCTIVVIITTNYVCFLSMEFDFLKLDLLL